MRDLRTKSPIYSACFASDFGRKTRNPSFLTTSSPHRSRAPPPRAEPTTPGGSPRPAAPVEAFHDARAPPP
jgi:hypothetical protein